MGVPTTRRPAAKGLTTRTAILDAVDTLLVETGYAAITSRRVAERVGINPGLVHYYFPTVDDLFVAAFRRGAERNLARMAAALASPEPLLALWRLSTDPAGVGSASELLAAANHRQSLRSELAEIAERARRIQIEALHELLPQYGIDEGTFPAALVAATIQGVALLVVREARLHLSTEHEAAAAAMESILTDLERRRKDRRSG